jgi:DNA-binding CsgD family transcriptional regulator
MLDFALQTPAIRNPDGVLDALNGIVAADVPPEFDLRVLGAARFPLRKHDWKSLKLGRSVFLHGSVPEGWWPDYLALSQRYHDISVMMARTSMAPYTWTERRLALEPVGIERWADELALKHGMRDGFTCPVGGRWVVGFWSRRVLGPGFSSEARVIVFSGASFAAIRLEQLAGADPNRLGEQVRLTPRELSVLRLLSKGMPFRDIAKALGLGEETVRTHIRKAQVKLGAQNRTQAVADVLRHQLIP